MAAPREVPILLGILVTLATLMGYFATVRLEQARARSERRSVTQPAARPVSEAEVLAVAGTVLGGLLGVAAQVRTRRAQLLREAAQSGTDARFRTLMPHQRAMLTRRTVLVLSLWGAFLFFSIGSLRYHPIAHSAYFLIPGALLPLPMRVYVRYPDGASDWVPWLMGSAALALVVTHDARYAWGPLGIAAVCYVCALRQERAKRRAVHAQ